nr:glycoside hydrolase family 3 protein [Lachnospiraceae bacterium]
QKVGPMSEIQTAEAAKGAGKTIGTYLSSLGFNLDFAPDADVLTEPENNVIGDRSFGKDPQRVTEFAKAYSDGLHEAGLLSCYKHFPGHGATRGDTHKGLAYTDKSLEDLKKSELIPFMNAQKDGADFVMVAHISLPTYLSDDTPCSLSEKMITDVLRKECGYEGLVITDALNMGAVTGQYGADQAAVMAVKAGADMILMPQNFGTAYEALLKAVEDGEIGEDRIDTSVKRILAAKLRL